MSTRIFRLEPTARPDDPRWELAPSHGVVIVRAISPADARIVAAAAEDDFLDIRAKPGDDASTRSASAFRDEKLYSVMEDVSGRFPDEGERGLLDGSMRTDVLKPQAVRLNKNL
jgi:hypothetical protein